MGCLVTTPFGRVEGTILDNGVLHFAGIPFAKPPVGQLRFRAPQMVEPWNDTLKATSYAKDPIQGSLQYGTEYYSEDCLYLNIWVPENAGCADSLRNACKKAQCGDSSLFIPSEDGDKPTCTKPQNFGEKAPVMIWIPGGAFATGGSGALKAEGPPSYNSANIAKESGCIVVTMSYRLNVFGFLNLNFLSDRFDDNVGMKDIIMCMRWVNEAIGAFGGDNTNVTLFGESAGAEAISAMLLAPEAQPYFHKAIIESNCFGSFYTVRESNEYCELFLKKAGLDKTSAEGLLDMQYSDLLAAANAMNEYVGENYMGRCSFCPVVDGEFITDYPTLANFEAMDKPVLVGSNKNEGTFQVAYMWPDATVWAPKLLRRLAPDKREELLATYKGLPSKETFSELLTDVMYTMPKIRFAERLSHSKSNVYVYSFDYYTPIMEKLGFYACHTAELLPLFETRDPFLYGLYMGYEAEVHEIGLRMRAYWAAFAKTGNPNVNGLTQWKPYTEEERNTLVIDKQDKLVVDAEADIRKRYEGIERILL